MPDDNFFNIKVGLHAEDVDRLNEGFYSRFNYPWMPMMLPSCRDPSFWAGALSMDLGYYGAQAFCAAMDIWVAGCGTNQAILTALNFPQARVTGSDVSAESLRVCARIAEQIGLTNLILKQESLNVVTYAEAFDYVLCTGVIHHNADPALPLASLSRALKPSGALELMVYNYYHRIQTTAFQKAIRLLGGGNRLSNVDREMPLARRLIDSFPAGSLMATMLAEQRHMPEAAVADVLLQPVEYSFTIASLSELAGRCGLRLATYCVNQFDKVSGRIDWETTFEDAEVARAYSALPDIDRWQVTNLLLGETSPRPWFYLQRVDAPRPYPQARELTGAFLDTVFKANSATVQNYFLSDTAEYQLSPALLPCPAPARPADPAAAAVFAEVDAKRPMRAILDSLGLTAQAECLRLRLATSGYPYLRPVPQSG